MVQDVKISLCMIVKDEEEMLPRCLESVKELVDEIVIVDTGSADRTVEIGRSFGARIIPYQWKGSFAAARNLSMDKARGKWLLLMDADEEMPLETSREIANLLNDQVVEGLILTIRSYRNSSSGTQTEDVPQIRIVKNRKKYRFSRAVHEQMDGSVVRSPHTLTRRDLVILHYGYLDERVIAKNKRERNEQLLLADIKTRKPDAYDYYYLALERGFRQDWTGAAKYYEKALQIADNNMQWVSRLMKDYISNKMNMGQFVEAVETADEVLQTYPDYADLHFLKGYALSRLGRLEEAVTAYQKAIESGEGNPAYICENGTGSHRAYNALADLYNQLGNHEQAIQYRTQTFEADPSQVQVLYTLVKEVNTHLGPAAFRAKVEPVLDMLNPSNVVLLIDACLYHGISDLAFVYISKAQKLVKGGQYPIISEQLTYLEGLAHFKKGNFPKAHSMLLRFTPQSPYYTQACLGLAYIEWIHGNKKRAQNFIENSGLGINGYRQLANLFIQEAERWIRLGEQRFPDSDLFRQLRKQLEEGLKNS
ncbi:MAG: glycosyltransferase [Heliobacteriaceae bacterium]|nr:glycosyltransferase [Heliobacteriaceae bacterium]MDD4587595.1 glycosyltransferase [Heliobacteriaceae bacterium]